MAQGRRRDRSAHDEVIYQDIIGPETVARLDGKIQLESKEDMKERGLPSPNKAMRWR
jgi:hypothetical protein